MRTGVCEVAAAPLSVSVTAVGSADDCEVMALPDAEDDEPIGHDNGTDPVADLFGLGSIPTISSILFISAGTNSAGTSAEVTFATLGGMPAIV